MNETMDETRYPVVFLDTNVLISAFGSYRNGKSLPFYLTDPDASRFTFEKCIYEAYMIFQGVSKNGGKWAEKYLDKDRDARPLNDLLNKYHKHNNIVNKFEGNYWINNIDGNEDLIDFCEDIMKNPDDKTICEDLLREIHVLKGLIGNRDLFEKLCNEFLKMIKDNNINILSYEDVFCIKQNRLSERATEDLLWMRDILRRTIIIPSEDFEIVYAAMRLRADIFVTDEDAIIEHAPSFGLNLPLSANSFCRGNPKEVKKNNDEKSSDKNSLKKEKIVYAIYDEKVKEWRMMNANNGNQC